ncbi:hypothetical protein PENTCL1PPCAC_16640, partial [Pristionchus entomophagus]
QGFIFAGFLAIPIFMFMSIPLLGVSDGILVQTIIILSMSSLVHCATLIASTPPFQKYIRKEICGVCTIMALSSYKKLNFQLCPSCDWIERGRNFAVLSKQGSTVDGITAVSTLFVYATIGLACAVHIMHIMRQYRKNNAQRGSQFTVTLRQTRQSLVQGLIFPSFSAIPLLMFMSVPLLGVSDEILVPTILLLSSSPLVHSVTLIASTPPFQKHIRQVV